MTTQNRPPNRFPGTDDLTGWPVDPKQPCIKGPETVCYLALCQPLGWCVYEPGGCPFFGHYPALELPPA